LNGSFYRDECAGIASSVFDLLAMTRRGLSSRALAERVAISNEFVRKWSAGYKDECAGIASSAFDLLAMTNDWNPRDDKTWPIRCLLPVIASPAFFAGRGNLPQGKSDHPRE
jgi:hypothetical protein